MFNWRDFFYQYNIPFSDKKNVSRGNLSVKCPYCGNADPSMHMTVSLTTNVYNCWLQANHRGRDPAYLVKALLGISYREAREIVYGRDDYIPADDDFVAEIEALLEPTKKRINALDVPKNWRPLSSKLKSPMRSMVFNYLVSRKYPKHDAEAIALKYQLYYALEEPWARRVIFPIYDERGRLVNFTGRAIYDNAQIRYKALYGGEAVNRMNECLFDYHRLIRTTGEILLVCEGPFDALRINWIGEPFGIHATCIFTQNVSESQAYKLERLAKNFERCGILFDHGAELQAIRAQLQLGFERFELPKYPKVKDPGDLSGNQLLAFCRNILFG